MILQGNAEDKLKELASDSVHCMVTSPPYYQLRDYLTGKWIGGDPNCNHRRDTKNKNPDFVIQTRWIVPGGVGDELMKSKCTKCGAVREDQQIGLEETPEEFIEKLVKVFREARRVLHPTGTLWINIADTYANSNMKAHSGERKNRDQGGMPGFRRKVKGMKRKDLIGIPWMLAFALRADGWYLRQDIIWGKPNPMPESVTDRCTKSHEYIFLLTKSEKYYYDAEAIKQEPSDSYKNDPRWKTGNSTNNDKHGYELSLAQNPKAPHRIFQQGAAPKANKRYVWRVNDPYAIWDWLFDNAPLEVVVPLWDKFVSESMQKNSLWDITTKPSLEDHFATYPEEIPAECIKAGSSEHGCCAKCGAPWHRVIKKKLVPTSKAVKSPVIDSRDINADANDQGSNRQKDGHKNGFINQVETLSWISTCKCDAEVIPCTVLDMFSGTGTTCRVAEKLGRRSIGIELNEKTAARSQELLNQRAIQMSTPSFTTVSGKLIYMEHVKDKRSTLRFLWDSLWKGQFDHRPQHVAVCLEMYLSPSHCSAVLGDSLLASNNVMWFVSKAYPVVGRVQLVQLLNINMEKFEYDLTPGQTWLLFVSPAGEGQITPQRLINSLNKQL